jgi:hypothetical protein
MAFLHNLARSNNTYSQFVVMLLRHRLGKNIACPAGRSVLRELRLTTRAAPRSTFA